MINFMKFIIESSKIDILNSKGGELYKIVFLNSVREANTIDFLNDWSTNIDEVDFNNTKTPFLIKGWILSNQIDIDKTKSESEISLKEKPTQITIRTIQKEDTNKKF
ncbi:hypothetical protein EOM09_08730 [bacterium]|nr:hypothetical protein [bacterium]